MKIKLKKIKGGYYADCEDLPGTPPCGTGRTKVDAVLCLLYRMMFDRPWSYMMPTEKHSFDRSWLSYIKKGPIVVNGKLWKDAKGLAKR